MAIKDFLKEHSAAAVRIAAGVVASIICVLIALFLVKGKIFIIPENMPISLEGYKRVFIDNSAWSHFLQIPTYDQTVFSFRTYIFIASKILSLELVQGLLLAKIVFVLVAAFGMYITLADINRRFQTILINRTPLLFGSLFYALSPSFLIGDGFWVGIQYGYYIIPIILFSVSKVVFDGKWQYLILFLLAVSSNNAAHYTFGGYPIIIAVNCFIIMIGNGVWDKGELYKIAVRGAVIALSFLAVISPSLVALLSPNIDNAAAMTKQSIDVPWASSTFTNASIGMTFNNLISDYYSGSMLTRISYGLLLFIPVALMLGIYVANNHSKLPQKYKRFLNVVAAIYVGIILMFAIGSVFKSAHYWFAFDAPMGRILRTTRVIDSLINVLLAFMIPAAVYAISASYRISHRVVLAFMGCTLIAYISPMLIGRINGPLIDMPQDYKDEIQFLSHAADSASDKMVAIPEFTASYGIGAVMKPSWSSNVGIITEFLGYSQPIQSILTLDNMRHYFYFTVSDFYKKVNNQLFSEDMYSLAHFLSMDNVKYVLFHTDTQSNAKDADIAAQFVGSDFWEKVYDRGNIEIFQNKVTQPSINTYSSRDTYVVSGGYRDASRYINQLPESVNQRLLFFYLDQGMSPAVMGKTDLKILSDKTRDDLAAEILASKVISDGLGPDSQSIFAAQLTRQYDPDKLWSTGSYSNNHQQEWHRHVNALSDYAWDFEWGKGLLFINGGTNTIQADMKQFKDEPMHVLVRYFKNEKGGEIEIGLGKYSKIINTVSEYDGFAWAIFEVNGSQIENKLNLTSRAGFNAVSNIMLLSDRDFSSALSFANSKLESSPVIFNSLDKSPNVLNQSSFEGISYLSNWSQSGKSGKYSISQDTETKINGRSSLRVSKSDHIPDWSWIEGENVSVRGGQKYVFETNIKIENVEKSHISLIGVNSGGERQLAQIPNAMSGTEDWRHFRQIVLIPADIVSVHVALNAGWAQEGSSYGSTWFDDISLRELTPAIINQDNGESVPAPQNVSKDSDARWSGTINVAKQEQMYLSLNESFDPGWKLFLVKQGQHQTFLDYISFKKPGYEVNSSNHIRANGINNSWRIDRGQLPSDLQGGEVGFQIEFWPQRMYLLAEFIVAGTLVLGAFLSLWLTIRNKMKAQKA